MLYTQKALLVVATDTQQIPHRAPALPEWANGNGEEGEAREGETFSPSTENSCLLQPSDKVYMPMFLVIKNGNMV